MRVIDIHIYYGDWHYPIKKTSVNDLLLMMKKFHIEKAVLTTSLGICYNFTEGNKAVRDAIEGHKELFGYVIVNFNYPEESLKEMAKYMKHDRFVGFKYHPGYSGLPVTAEQGEPILAAMERYGKPLLLHTYSGPLKTPLNAVQVARKYPKLKIILGHMGGPAWEEGVAAVRLADNLYVDPCCTCAVRDKIAEVVKAVGAKRLLFGSGMMQNHAGFTLGMIDDAQITSAEKKRILYQNAAEMFGI